MALVDVKSDHFDGDGINFKGFLFCNSLHQEYHLDGVDLFFLWREWWLCCFLVKLARKKTSAVICHAQKK